MTLKPNGDGEETDDEDVDSSVCPRDYIPKDPWCIHVRWRKDGMYPGGTIHASSANNSRQDLTQDPSRCISGPGSTGSPAASTTSMITASDPGSGAYSARADGSCYVYMDVQLYTIEAGSDKSGGGTYLVDFKCAGYESLVNRALGEAERALVGSGYRIANKDVTSPQPFLDLTNKLVIHLAGGGA